MHADDLADEIHRPLHLGEERYGDERLRLLLGRHGAANNNGAPTGKENRKGKGKEERIIVILVYPMIKILEYSE